MFASGSKITVEDLPEEFLQDAFADDLHDLAVLPDLERTAILKALQESSGHQERAAAVLGISRRTLQRRMKSYRSRHQPITG